MIKEAQERTVKLQLKRQELNIPLAIITDESSIAYLAGFWGYLGVEFGRPTMLLIFADSDPLIITPLVEAEMVSKMTWVEKINIWEDTGENTWSKYLYSAILSKVGNNPKSLWVEKNQIPQIVRIFLDETFKLNKIEDIGPILGEMRTIKSPLEISIMKQAGLVARSMMEAAHKSLSEGTPEYESALSVIEAGTRKAAGFLTSKGWEKFISPMIYNLQILNSGKDNSMSHRRASLKTYKKFDPVYFCFCNMAQFKQYKLGFDRMFFIQGIKKDAERIQETAIYAQQAALAAIRPGVKAEEIANIANIIYKEKGYTTAYRTGRSIGMSYLESPELKKGDKTTLKAGMTFAVDGGISIDGEIAGRIGDSIVVTETGFEYLTEYDRTIMITSK
jgi:Xaa-Pro aminopeptidase